VKQQHCKRRHFAQTAPRGLKWLQAGDLLPNQTFNDTFHGTFEHLLLLQLMLTAPRNNAHQPVISVT